VRRLAQPKVVASAAIAAAASTLLSLPRMLLWEDRKFYLWYVEATIFFCGFVLWAFVFAWHSEYSHRPVFTLKIKPLDIAIVTLLGILGALASRCFFDPYLRTINPEEYPADLTHWLASILFVLTFSQLFLVFAPYAWAIRLFRNEKLAMGFTVALGVAVWLLKIHSSPHALPSWLFFSLFLSRIIQGFFLVFFYLRGGILLVWWLGLLVEARHLLDFH
jgi:hypothetical protein